MRVLIKRGFLSVDRPLLMAKELPSHGLWPYLTWFRQKIPAHHLSRWVKEALIDIMTPSQLFWGCKHLVHPFFNPDHQRLSVPRAHFGQPCCIPVRLLLSCKAGAVPQRLGEGKEMVTCPESLEGQRIEPCQGACGALN